MTKRRVGIIGNSIRGFVGDCIEAADESDRWEVVELDIPRANDSRPVLLRWASRVPEYIRALSLMKSVDVVMCIFVESRTAWWVKRAHAMGKKVVLYWLGSDVDNLNKGILPVSGLHAADSFWSYSEGNIEELGRFGFMPKLLVLPSKFPLDLAKMPLQHEVLLSLPDERKEFYGYNDLIRLIDDYPQLTFHVVRSQSPEYYDRPNVVFEGMLTRDQMNDVFDKISISIRWPEHDSTSLVLMESAIKGKYIISRNPFPVGSFTRTYEGLRSALDDILKKPVEPCKENHEYAIAHFTQKSAGVRLVSYLDELLGENDLCAVSTKGSRTQ